VDPTLGQLEVFANEDTGPRVGANLAQAAMLNFGSSMGAAAFPLWLPTTLRAI